MTKKLLLQFLMLSVVVATHSSRGFIHLSTTPTHPSTRYSLLLLQLKMVGGGGKGWDNNSYLDNLGGDEDDLNKSKQDYQEFHERQQAFLKRQEERMKSPQMQAFLKQQQQQAEQSWLTSDADNDDDISEDEYADLGGSSGGSRFRHMMQQQSKLQRGNNKDQLEFNSMFGEQKFVVPLDEDDDEEEEENNEMEGN